MAGWTAADMPDRSGRVALVTGASSGLGLVTARELARVGATVVMAVRDLASGDDAAVRIRRAVPDARLELARLDLADLASVRAFAEELADRHDWVDPLVNNADVLAVPYRKTVDGFEMQLGTNHLCHFALTGRLLPAMVLSAEPRVVTVSSGAHRMGRIDFDDLQSERRYERWTAYGQSKLANLLFMFELGRRAAAAGTALRSVAAHPGYADTNLKPVGPRMSGSRLMERASRLANRLVAQSAEQGALPTLYAATVPGLPSGSFVGPDGPLEARGHPQLVGASARARDEQAAHRQWEISETLTGVRYDFAAHAAATG
jgi:NAD(P)-dependent dehydrogenase (short-subunit alcohol dehydrogenase family)